MILRIERPAYGPFGIARRNDGKIVLVREGVPGDLVEVLVVKETSSMVEARISRILEASAYRIQPSCKDAYRCSGCSWAHISREGQLRFKREVLERTLQGLSWGMSQGTPEPMVTGENERGYRRRARLHASARRGEEIRIGFFSRGTQDIVPIEGCEVCTSALDRAIAALARFTSPWEFSSTIELISDDEDRVLAAFFLSQQHPDPTFMARELARGAGLAGVMVASPGHSRGEWGIQHSHIRVQADPPVRIPVHPAAFCQANGEVNELLVRHVVAVVMDRGTYYSPFESHGFVRNSNRPSSRRSIPPLGRGRTADDQNPKAAATGCVKEGRSEWNVLELYAGHGNFTFPLAASGACVTAVEIGLNRSILPKLERVKFIRSDVVSALKRLRSRRGKFDVVLLDPPRTGAREAMPLILDLEPARIVYVSCDPNTFARDARTLLDQGYLLSRITPFDMVPQTHHVELVAVLSRG